MDVLMGAVLLVRRDEFCGWGPGMRTLPSAARISSFACAHASAARSSTCPAWKLPTWAEPAPAATSLSPRRGSPSASPNTSAKAAADAAPPCSATSSPSRSTRRYSLSSGEAQYLLTALARETRAGGRSRPAARRRGVLVYGLVAVLACVIGDIAVSRRHIAAPIMLGN